MKKAVIISGYVLLIFGALSMVMPFLWMIGVSFMEESQIFSSAPTFIPEPFTLKNYAAVLTKMPVIKYFFNSLLVASLTTIFQVIISAMAGYVFAKVKFRYREIIFFIFLITMMIPPQVNIIPLFFIMRELNWIDTYQALILPGVFGGFGVFLMRQWFCGFSQEIEDAARIDGCNFFETFFKISLPLALPALMTLGIFTFITTWNSFMWPLIVTNSENITTLPVAIAQFRGSFREITDWGALMACSVLLSLPVIALFLVGKKYFINDILAGSIKE